MFPKARQERLTTCELPDETLVYDHDRRKGHCLNATSALVWRHCDGQTSLDELARRLAESESLSAEAAVHLVSLALEQLGRRHLLEQAPASLPAERRVSRRDALRRLAFVVALPLVMTVATKAAAQSISVPPEDPPTPRPINVNVGVAVNVVAGVGRQATPPPPAPCRTKGQSCVATASGQQGTCCPGLACTGVAQNAGVRA